MYVPNTMRARRHNAAEMLRCKDYIVGEKKKWSIVVNCNNSRATTLPSGGKQQLQLHTYTAMPTRAASVIARVTQSEFPSQWRAEACSYVYTPTAPTAPRTAVYGVNSAPIHEFGYMVAPKL